jgi:hypothetical protein
MSSAWTRRDRYVSREALWFSRINPVCHSRRICGADIGQRGTFWSRRARSLASINRIVTNPVVKSCGADSQLVRGSGERFARTTPVSTDMNYRLGESAKSEYTVADTQLFLPPYWGRTSSRFFRACLALWSIYSIGCPTRRGVRLRCHLCCGWLTKL